MEAGKFAGKFAFFSYQFVNEFQYMPVCLMSKAVDVFTSDYATDTLGRMLCLKGVHGIVSTAPRAYATLLDASLIVP